MKWIEKPEIVSYIIDCYAGVDKVGGRVKRQFIWEELNGDTVIGNSRAFSDHLAKRFELPLTETSWVAVHELLRALGEVAQIHSPKTRHLGKHFQNQEPEVHVLRKRKLDDSY